MSTYYNSLKESALLREREITSNAKAAESVSAKRMREILAATAKTLSPMAGKMVVDNYNATGLGKNSKGTYRQTGLLARVLSQTRLVLYIKNGKLKASLKMMPNAPNFDGQTQDNGLYKAAAALNYGAVHGASKQVGQSRESVIATRTKKSIKKIHYGIARSNAGGGRTQAERNANLRLAALRASGRDIKVRKAYGFFQLNAAQTARIRSLALQMIKRKLGNGKAKK